MIWHNNTYSYWLRLLIFGVLILSLISCSTRTFIPESHQDNILAMVTFDKGKPGETYGNWDVKRDFGTVKSWGTYWPFRRLKIDSSTPPRNEVLRVSYPKQKVRFFSSGGSWQWKPFHPRQEAFFSYWVFFPDSFVFRAGGKLHGLIGGKANTGGKKPNGHDGWSCRAHWVEDLIILYIYHKDQKRQWGDTFYFTQNPKTIFVNADQPIERDRQNEIRIERGKWHHIMIRVRVNAVGYRDGLAQAWYDGKLVLDVRGFEFRDEICKADELLIKGAYFSTFFGGRDERYKPVKDEYALFDDFVISKQLYCPPGLEYDPVPD
jgi:hypothetical protein